jgi:sugar phosphate isomerase/epimerase
MSTVLDRWGLWWGSLEGADLVTLVRCAGRAGFGEVSCTPAMYLAARAGGWTDAALGALLADCGVRVPMIDPLMRGLPGARAPEDVSPRWRSTFEHDEDDCHRAADALGATIINVTHFLGAPTPVDVLADALGPLTARAAARGRRAAIEAMPEGGIPDVATAADLVARIGSPACGLTVDTWHWWRAGGDLDELRTLRPGTVVALQVSDARSDARGAGTEPPSRDRLPIGTGDLPLHEILAWVRVASPAAHVGLEVFDRTAAGRPFDESAAAAAAHVVAFDRASGRSDAR